MRVTIAAAGLGGLAATAAFARPVLRARPREQDLEERNLEEPGQGEPERHDAREQAGAGRRAGAAEPARPLR